MRLTVPTLAGAVASAQVDLNPHQVDAALFAFNSPLAKGALLATRLASERRSRPGLSCPRIGPSESAGYSSSPRPICENSGSRRSPRSSSFRARSSKPSRTTAAIKQGNFRPLDARRDRHLLLPVCAEQGGRRRQHPVGPGGDRRSPPAAQRLQALNVIANTLKQALANAPKLLLTATPLQNSLLELFGLVSFIDEHTFGDLKSFREQFANLSQEQVFHTLRSRLKPICHRTLRRQVTSYIPYTKRPPLVEELHPGRE